MVHLHLSNKHTLALFPRYICVFPSSLLWFQNTALSRELYFFM